MPKQIQYTIVLYRAVGGVDRHTYAVELEFFDEVIPQVQKCCDYIVNHLFYHLKGIKEN